MGEILSVLKVIITSTAISLSSQHKGPLHACARIATIMPRRRVLALAHAGALPRLRAPASLAHYTLLRFYFGARDAAVHACTTREAQ